MSGTGSCCPPGSSGVLPADKVVDGKGKELKHEGASLYVTGKEGTGRAVLVAPDVWGWGVPKCSRIREVCDLIAEATDSLVVAADFFPGKPLFTVVKPGAKDFMQKFQPWCKSFDKKIVDPIQEALVSYGEKHGAKDSKVKLGVIGFCWGSWIVKRLSASDKLSCGVSCHPSHVFVGGMHGDKEEELLDAVKCPQMMLAAGGDPESTKPGGLADKIYSKKPFGKQCHLEEFKDMNHGWTLREDGAKDENVDKQQKRAIGMAIDFFKKHLA